MILDLGYRVNPVPSLCSQRWKRSLEGGGAMKSIIFGIIFNLIMQSLSNFMQICINILNLKNLDCLSDLLETYLHFCSYLNLDK